MQRSKRLGNRPSQFSNRTYRSSEDCLEIAGSEEEWENHARRASFEALVGCGSILVCGFILGYVNTEWAQSDGDGVSSSALQQIEDLVGSEALADLTLEERRYLVRYATQETVEKIRACLSNGCSWYAVSSPDGGFSLSFRSQEDSVGDH